MRGLTLLPDRSYLIELKRPWKLATFAAGMAWLLYGALRYNIPDWDVGISLLMGGLTYLCAPWSVRTILVCLRDRPAYWPLWIVAALLIAVGVIDGSYAIYNSLARHPMLRDANFYASTPLYFLAGMIWLYRGSLRDLRNEFSF